MTTDIHNGHRIKIAQAIKTGHLKGESVAFCIDGLRYCYIGPMGDDDRYLVRDEIDLDLDGVTFGHRMSHDFFHKFFYLGLDGELRRERSGKQCHS